MQIFQSQDDFAGIKIGYNKKRRRKRKIMIKREENLKQKKRKKKQRLKILNKIFNCPTIFHMLELMFDEMLIIHSLV